MWKYRVKQDLIVLKLDSVSIKKILVTKFVAVKVLQNLNLMESFLTQWNQQHIRHVQMFGTKHLKTNWLQKTIEYQTNELSTKYSNWNAEI